MSDEENATSQMEADIAGMARRFAPTNVMPRVVAERPDNVRELIGAGAVGKRLETLLQAAGELAKQAEGLATALAGPSTERSRAATARRPPGDHLFGKQMSSLDELEAIHDTLRQALERAHRSLA